jgi:hypothetical protein
MKQLKIDFDIQNNTENHLDFKIFVDQNLLYSSNTTANCSSVLFDYNDTDISEHCFRLVICGKRLLIDSKDDADAALILNSLRFNNINILPAVRMTYSHNQNGFGDSVVEQYQKNDINLFYGFDGEVSFEFFTPLSYWIVSEYPF